MVLIPMSTEEFRILLGFLGAMAALGTGAKVILTWIKRPRATGALPPELSGRTFRRRSCTPGPARTSGYTALTRRRR